MSRPRLTWHLTTALLVASGGSPTGVGAQASTPEPPLRALVDSVATAVVESGRVAGISIAIAQGDEMLLLERYGWADLERRLPMPPGAVFEIGSITKQFTAAAILLLAEEGRLSLDDEVTRHLPGVTADLSGISVRQLLHHTAGIPDFTEMPGFAGLVAGRPTRDAIVSFFGEGPRLFGPGEAMVYSNSGYFLLGLIIEEVSGLSYADYIRTRLFQPLVMRSSSYCAPDEGRGIRAVGHGRSASGTLLPTEALDHTWPFAAGSLCSTATDLAAWNAAVHGGEILSPDSYREFTAGGRLVDGTILRYAAGLMLDSIADRSTFRHGGSVPGFRAHLAYFPADRLTVAVLLNTYGPVDPADLVESIAGAIYGPDLMVSRPLDRPAADFIGVYRGIGRAGAKSVIVELDGYGSLTLRVDRRPPLPLVYLGEDVFGAGAARLYFLGDGQRVDAVRLDEIAENTVLDRAPAY